MKKIWILVIVTISVLTLSGCFNQTPVEEAEDPVIVDPNNPNLADEKLEFIDIYYLNDLHGAIEANDYNIGLSYIANFINTKRAANPNNTLLLAGGDMFQGSALSNYYQGLSTVQIMNVMKFDAMVVGNHEFDWGIETVANYFDESATADKATFPLLGANVVYEGTNDIVENIKPYTIIQRQDTKIGIIGTMGYGLESSIAQSKIDGYEFKEPVNVVKTYTKELRNIHKVDVVIVVSHDPGAGLNSGLTGLTGEYKVDAIFNAHSHRESLEITNSIPIIQSKANGERVGFVRIALSDKYKTETINYKKSSDPLFNVEDPAVKALIDGYKAETDTLFKEKIITNKSYIGRTELTKWVAQVMMVKTNADIAFHNSGGTRVDFFDGESINLAKLYQVLPFDNVVKSVYLTGSQINNLMYRSDLEYSKSVETFKSSTLYKVTTNDYVFDKDNDVFIGGTNPSNDGYVLRDIVQDELLLQKEVYPYFETTNLLLTNQATLSFYNMLTRDAIR